MIGAFNLSFHGMEIVDPCDCSAEYEKIKGGNRQKIRSTALAAIGDLETFSKTWCGDSILHYRSQILEITWTQGHQGHQGLRGRKELTILLDHFDVDKIVGC